MTVLIYGILLVLNHGCVQSFLHEYQVLKVAGFYLQRHSNELSAWRNTWQPSLFRSFSFWFVTVWKGVRVEVFLYKLYAVIFYEVQLWFCVASCNGEKLWFASLKHSLGGNERGSTCKLRTIDVWCTGSYPLSAHQAGRENVFILSLFCVELG